MDGLSSFVSSLQTYMQVTELAAYCVFVLTFFVIVLIVMVAFMAQNVNRLREAVAHLVMVQETTCKLTPAQCPPGQTMKVDNARYDAR